MKRFIILALLPLFCLASCSREPASPTPIYVEEGSQIERNEFEHASSTPTSYSDYARKRMEKGISIEIVNEIKGNTSSISSYNRMTFKGELTPTSINLNIGGFLKQTTLNNSVSLALVGEAKAHRSSTEEGWIIDKDENRYEVDGQYNVEDGFTFNGNPDVYYEILLSELGSWSFTYTPFGVISYDFDEYAVIDHSYITNDITTGTFEVGIKEPFSIEIDGGMIQTFQSYYFSFSEFLLRKAVVIIETSNPTSSQVTTVLFEANVSYR